MFQTSASNRAEKAFHSKRAQEDRTQSLRAQVKSDFMVKAAAEWENKGKEVEKVQYTKKRLEELRDESKRQLEERRYRLNQLLKEEEASYREELKSLDETPAQVRERMINRVAELKENREKARKADVERLLDRRFRENADELRKVESNINELRAVHDRNIQMMERQKQLIQQYEEELVYAELWKRDAARKERKEIEDSIKRKEGVDARNQILAFQTTEIERKRQEMKDQVEREKQMLKREWQNEAERQRAQEEEQLRINKELNRDLIEHNRVQREFKDRIEHNEKTADKDMVQRIIEREKMLDQLDHEAREKARKETRDFLLNFKNRTDEYHTHEAELERLIREEDQKQWRKREEVWKKEEDARIKLLYETYDARASNIQEKKNKIEQDKQFQSREKARLDGDLRQFNDDEERRRYEKLLKAKQHQQELLRQISDKHDKTKKALESKLSSEKADIQRDLEYLKRVQEEQDKGKRDLLELAKVRPF